ncbi:Fc.00g050430.m01.CDS01 [Cosmosporella sp. VM-42]
MASIDVREDGFPARSREASGLVNGVATEATSTSFSDKILITISQEGRLSQWIQVPLAGTSAGLVEMTIPSSSRGLLPSTHLTPKTLLGGGGEERETLGQLYAAQVASHLNLRSPDDRRTLVLGLGLVKIDTEREAFFDLLELVQKVL